MAHLFNDDLQELTPSPAQQQAEAARKAAQNERQRRCRARKKARASGAPEEVTPSADAVTLFDAISDTPMSLAVDLLLHALRELSRTESEISRASILRAMAREARGRGITLLSPERFLEAAIERGDVPRLDDSDWVKVPREVLNIKFGGQR